MSVSSHICSLYKGMINLTLPALVLKQKQVAGVFYTNRITFIASAFLNPIYTEKSKYMTWLDYNAPLLSFNNVLFIMFCTGHDHLDVYIQQNWIELVTATDNVVQFS